MSVFEPGFMPGTGLKRQASPGARSTMRGLQRLPGVSSPAGSGPALASVVLDEHWSYLRDGAFVVIDKERAVKPIANAPQRERRLWKATVELLDGAARTTG